MKITKIFTVESSHIVRNCTSERCSHSIHGHSYKIEICLESSHLDNACMVLDFGLMKGSVKQFIDSMDHCHIFCVNDDPEYIDLCRKFSDRWISLPFNPSAEMLSLFIFRFVSEIIKNTDYSNGECNDLHVHSVTVHETATGKAECTGRDMENIWNELWMPLIVFSDGVVKDWSKETTDAILKGSPIKTKKIKQQIKLVGFNCECS